MDVISFINQTAFYFGAIFVSLSCFVYTEIQDNGDKPQTKILFMALWVTIITAVCDMTAIYVEPYCMFSEVARKALYVSNYLYYILHNFMALFLCYYSFFATQSFIKMKRVNQFVYMIPWVISELFMLTNPINHISWTFDDSYHLQRGAGVTSAYIAGAIYSVIAFYYLMFRWYAATKKRRMMLLVSFGMMLMGIVIQFFLPDMVVELFFEALNFLGIMLAVEYDDDRIDAVTRLFNRNSFIQDAGYYYDTHSHFHVIILRLTNYDTYQKMPDAYDINEVVESLAEGLKSVYLRFTTYRVTRSCFVLLVLNKDQEYVDDLANKVYELYKDGFNLPTKDDRIAGVVMQTEASKTLSSVRELLLMCEMEFKNLKDDRVMKDDDLSEFYDRAGIERAIREGLSQQHFDVCYQLVYDAKTQMVNSAEALLRLEDPELGEILPRVFIPAAERNGMIDVLGEFVLREVCRLIKTEIPDKVGMRYINVNLSVLQCMQPHFVERVKKIVNEEGVEPSRINFEITESVAPDDYRYLAEVMRECRELGFMFSMEGYGSGYSNMYSVFSLDFDEIKLDKTLLWEADRNEQGRIVLENSIRMVHEMGKPVVAVGVETKEQIERLKLLDVEYLQGFYYMEPKPAMELK